MLRSHRHDQRYDWNRGLNSIVDFVLFVLFHSLRLISNIQLNRDGSSCVEPVLS